MSDEQQDTCPKCGSELKPVEETPSGKKLQRCSAGAWNPETKKVEGCPYVRWITPDPENLDEKCPKCGAPLQMVTTRFGKKLKKCSTGGWDRESRQSTGCDYVEWISKSSTEQLEEDCPQCGSKLVLFTTSKGKKMKKCSTSKWDPSTRQASGCTFVQWL